MAFKHVLCSLGTAAVDINRALVVEPQQSA